MVCVRDCVSLGSGSLFRSNPYIYSYPESDPDGDNDPDCDPNRYTNSNSDSDTHSNSSRHTDTPRDGITNGDLCATSQRPGSGDLPWEN
jgi:hypothetical protein